MDPQRVEVLHVADRDAVVPHVADDLRSRQRVASSARSSGPLTSLVDGVEAPRYRCDP